MADPTQISFSEQQGMAITTLDPVTLTVFPSADQLNTTTLLCQRDGYGGLRLSTYDTDRWDLADFAVREHPRRPRTFVLACGNTGYQPVFRLQGYVLRQALPPIQPSFMYVQMC